MTKLILELRGEKHDLVDAVAGAPMQTLKILNLSSQLSGGADKLPPVTPKSINDCIQGLFAKAAQEGFTTLDLLDDVSFMQNIQGCVFLIRRRRGEQITFDEAGDFTIHEISVGAEADETEEPAAPKDPEAPPPTAA